MSEQQVDTSEVEHKEAVNSEPLSQEAVSTGISEQGENDKATKKIPLGERLVKRVYEENGEKKEEVKKISEIISLNKKDGDSWETVDGKKVISHQGILKLADFVGAHWLEPRIDDKPNSNNDRGFYFHFTCVFPDGSTAMEVGSANDINARSDISNQHKYEMAYKRGMDRSFLNSRYMKLYDVYSADEADTWSKEKMLEAQLEAKEKQIKEYTEKLMDEIMKRKEETAKVVKRNEFIDKLITYMALPEGDGKYPRTYIQLIIEDGDTDYVENLKQHEDENIRFAAVRLLKLHTHKAKQKEKEEQEARELEEREVQNAQVQTTSDEENNENEPVVTSSEGLQKDEPKITINNSSKPFDIQKIEEVDETTEQPYEKMNFALHEGEKNQ